MDELIRAVDEIFVGNNPSEDDLYGIHQVLAERRDAELARQSVMDEAVQRAIEWAEQERKNSFRYMDFGDADSTGLTIVAPRQYQKPTDEAVQNMVQTFESFLSSGHDADWTGDTVSNQYLHDAILTALRQMKSNE